MTRADAAAHKARPTRGIKRLQPGAGLVMNDDLKAYSPKRA